MFAAGDVLVRTCLASVGEAQAAEAVVAMFGPGLESQLPHGEKEGEGVVVDPNSCPMT